MIDGQAAPRRATPGAEIQRIELEISDLQADLSMIATQLADRERRNNIDGAPLSWREHNAWRGKALYARTKKEQQLRELKMRRKALLREGQALVAGGGDEIAGCLAALCRLLILRAQQGGITPDEQRALDRARDVLIRAYGDNALGGRVTF